MGLVVTDTAKRLFGPALLTASAATKITAGPLTIIRQIHLVNTDTTATRTATISIGADAAGTRIFRVPVPAGITWDWNGFIVLNAADIVQAYADTTNVIAMTVSGIEIT